MNLGDVRRFPGCTAKQSGGSSGMGRHSAGRFAAFALGLAAVLGVGLPRPAFLCAATVSAESGCPEDQSAGGYCADGSCHSFAVGKDGVVRCMDNPLPPGTPAPADVEFQIGIGAAGF